MKKSKRDYLNVDISGVKLPVRIGTWHTTGEVERAGDEFPRVGVWLEVGGRRLWYAREFARETIVDAIESGHSLIMG